MREMLSAVSLVVVAAGCSSSTSLEPFDRACFSGERFECGCSNGASGVQTCNESGTAVLPCDCTSSSRAGNVASTSSNGSSSATISDPSSTTISDPSSTTISGPSSTTVSGTSATISGDLPSDTGPGDMPSDTGLGGMPSDTGIGGAPPDLGETSGACCSDGDCLCHGPEPTALTSSAGPFGTDSYRGSTGTIHYPTDAEPPFAAVALCGGFLNTGPEMEPWGPFYASHGIVTLITTTTGADLPDLRATKLLAAIEELKGEHTGSGPLAGKLAGRYGTSGYSMGGGGTTLATTSDPTLRTSVGLAAWAPVGTGIEVPTLLLCGAADTVAPCSHSEASYNDIPESTPKMMVTISGAAHLDWFGPTNAGMGIAGETALAFQKVYLEGDERWKPFLLGQVGGTVVTNIQ